MTNEQMNQWMNNPTTLQVLQIWKFTIFIITIKFDPYLAKKVPYKVLGNRWSHKYFLFFLYRNIRNLEVSMCAHGFWRNKNKYFFDEKSYAEVSDCNSPGR